MNPEVIPEVVTPELVNEALSVTVNGIDFYVGLIAGALCAFVWWLTVRGWE